MESEPPLKQVSDNNRVAQASNLDKNDEKVVDQAELEVREDEDEEISVKQDDVKLKAADPRIHEPKMEQIDENFEATVKQTDELREMQASLIVEAKPRALSAVTVAQENTYERRGSLDDPSDAYYPTPFKHAKPLLQEELDQTLEVSEHQSSPFIKNKK